MSNPPDQQNGGGASPPSLHRPDIFVAIVILAVCGFLFVNTFWFDEVPSSLAQNVQPGMFPRLVLICIAAITLLVPFEYHMKIRHGIDLDSDRSVALGWIVPITGICLILFVATMPWFGALPALILIAAVMPLMWGERRWKILIPYVILFPAAVIYLFSELLRVNFPGGIWG